MYITPNSFSSQFNGISNTNRKNSIGSVSGVSSVKFGSVATETVGKTVLEIRPPGRLMRALDFQSFGQTIANQVKLIYACIILSRLVAAATRSKNELRETAVRDGTGFAVYLFTVPMMERLMLWAMDRNYQLGLIEKRPKPVSSGLKGAFSNLMYAINPIYRWDIRSSRQIRDHMEQMLERLTEAGHGKESVLYKNTMEEFNKLVVKANVVKGLGVLFTIALLGVILPFINIAVTRKKLMESDRGQIMPHDVVHHHPAYH